MIIPDTNLLIYAYNSDVTEHKKSRLWWETALNGNESVGLPWVVISAFIRLTTNRAVVRRPLTAEQVAQIVESWLDQPVVREVVPGTGFRHNFLNQIRNLGMAGKLTTDAQIAAHAIEHGATVFSNVSDFDRFPGLRWRNPIKSS